MNVLYRDVFSVTVFGLMTTPVILYASKLNGQVIIDLTGILERMAIIYITELSKSFPDRQTVVQQLLGKQNLDDLAGHLVSLGLWDKEDKGVAENLKKRRDGLAHKNAKLICRYINDNKPFDFFRLNEV